MLNWHFLNIAPDLTNYYYGAYCNNFIYCPYISYSFKVYLENCCNNKWLRNQTKETRTSRQRNEKKNVNNKLLPNEFYK